PGFPPLWGRRTGPEPSDQGRTIGLVTELVPPKQNWLRPADAPTTKSSKHSDDGFTLTIVSGASSRNDSSGCDARNASIDWLSMSWRNVSFVRRWIASRMSSGVQPAFANT